MTNSRICFTTGTVLLLLLSPPFAASVSWGKADEVSSTHAALVALYTATGGARWNHNDGWDTGTVPASMEDFNQWHGITVDGGKLVTIALASNNLRGELPSELGNLSYLEGLFLYDNQLTGEIPSEFGNLSSLTQLALYDNQLTGELPSELGNLSSLTGLYLHKNQLTGELPSELNSLLSLEQLTLQDNQLAGEIFPELGNLLNLQVLVLYGNQFTGGIPSELGNLSNLQELVLYGNQLTGGIPSELGNLLDLQELVLYGNQLTGEIPSRLGNLPKLRGLYLHENQLTGEIPGALGNLSTIDSLSLHKNQLTGKIPTELGNLSTIDSLSLGDNQLTGEIPTALGNLSNLKSLSLGGNQLTGEIPTAFGKLSSLVRLDLSDNQLTGSLPPELGSLSDLARLWLHENPLTGKIPRSFLQLGNLQSLLLPDGVCAPQDDEFQTWLSTTFPDMTFSACTGISFTGQVDNQSYPLAQTISPLTLPEATAGVPPITYALIPALPQGLSFDGSTRIISGTPTEITPAVMYTYKATDAHNSRDSLQFSIEVYSSVSAEQESLPEKFVVHSSYPNPFRHTTSIRLDLPWPAQMGIEVLDMMGRRVFVQPPIILPAGSGQEIVLHEMPLSSGAYLYRLTADSPEGRSVHLGQFVRIR